MSNPLPLRIRAADTDPPADPTGSPLVVDARRLAQLLCVGLRTLRTWDAGGRLPAPVRIGGRVLWRLDEIRAWLDAGAPCREDWDAIRAARK
jgi:predicted DNA-binding transcriptional regulator AlpA